MIVRGKLGDFRVPLDRIVHKDLSPILYLMATPLFTTFYHLSGLPNIFSYESRRMLQIIRGCLSYQGERLFPKNFYVEQSTN